MHKASYWRAHQTWLAFRVSGGVASVAWWPREPQGKKRQLPKTVMFQIISALKVMSQV